MRELVSCGEAGAGSGKGGVVDGIGEERELKLVAAEALGDGEFVVVGALDALAAGGHGEVRIALAEVGGSRVKALGGAQIGCAGGVAVVQDRVLAGVNAERGKGTVAGGALLVLNHLGFAAVVEFQRLAEGHGVGDRKSQSLDGGLIRVERGEVLGGDGDLREGAVGHLARVGGADDGIGIGGAAESAIERPLGGSGASLAEDGLLDMEIGVHPGGAEGIAIGSTR